MRYTLTLSGVVVGHSDLEHADRGVGRAWGAFRPGMGYELVQPVFQLYAEAAPRGGAKDSEKLERYYKARDALPLQLRDDAGRQIKTSTIHIADFGRGEPPSVELDVLIADEGYWSAR